MRLLLVLCLVCTSTYVLAGKEWWKTAIFYQIYPRSFKDSDNDGVGDIRGITSKVEYLNDIGVNAVWLSPIYKSPMADFGYDVSNYREIDPIFGDMTDLKELFTELKKRGIQIIMDFVPNHSSDEHPWFTKSVNKEGNYGDYYVWRDKNGDYPDGKPREPNNWQGCFGGSAWTWDETRQQFYLHQFLSKQPDLNFRNPQVIQEIKDSMEFWLDFGVDGFRVDAVKHLVEDDTFPDEPVIDDVELLSYDNLDHIYTTNQNLTFEIIQGWTDLIKEKNKDGHSRIMFLEVYNKLPQMMAYYGKADAPFAMPFNFYLLEVVKSGVTAEDLVSNIDEWLRTMPSYGTANWVVGNHDISRVPNRVGSEMADAFNMILAMLPGPMITYNGEELGMTNAHVRFEDAVDPRGTVLGPLDYESLSRDPERTPMQWDDTQNAGFSEHKTWLPVNPNYWYLNVEAQKKADTSHLKVYRSLSKLRQTATFLSEKTEYVIRAPHKDTFVITRSSPEGETYILIVNLGTSEVTTVLKITGVDNTSVFTGSINSGLTEGDNVVLSKGVSLRPQAAVILRTQKSAGIISHSTS